MKTPFSFPRSLPALFLLAAPLAAAHANASAGTTSRNEAQAERAAASNNRFGLNLFRSVAAARPGENTLVSPLSATLALSMALNGAEGETRAELARALESSSVDLASLNEDATALVAALTGGRSDETVRVANSLWADQDRFEFDPAYLSSVRSAYDAELRTLPFLRQDPTPLINGWVSGKTGGMIPKLLDHLSRETVAVLVNALYFQGTWTHPLYRSHGGPDDFHTADGRVVPATMMGLAENDGYAETAEVKMLSLAFRAKQADAHSRGNFRLDLLLPTEGQSAANLVTHLDAEAYAGLVSSLRHSAVHGRIPRLKFDMNTSLKSTLRAMGVSRAFSPGLAELSPLGHASAGGEPTRLFIEDVVQGTALDLDENGLKAAAATAVLVATRSAVFQDHKEFVANRPFLLVLRHAPTGAILFAGQVSDPTLK